MICKSQDLNPMSEFEKCYFNALPDNGKQLKKYFTEYESILIDKKVLKDNSGKSYLNLIKRAKNFEYIDTQTDYSFIDSINKLDYSDLIHSNSECSERMQKLIDYKNSRSYELGLKIDSIQESENQPDQKVNALLTKLVASDFEFDSKKIRALLLMELMNSMHNENDDE